MLKILNKKLFFVTLLVTITTSTVNAQPISFKQAWSILQAKNNSLAAQRANVEHYKQLQEASDALNYPSISLSANYSRLDDTNEDISDTLTSMLPSAFSAYSSLITSASFAEEDAMNASIDAFWAIYTGGKITAAQDYSEAKSEEAKAKLEMETQSRYEDLSKFYYTVVLAKGVLKTRKTVEEGLKKHRDFSIKLEQQGQIAKVERLQADASLAKAVVDRKKSEMDLEIATSALTEVLNQNNKVIPESNLFINDSLPNLTLFTEQTIETFPGLDVLTAKQKQAESSIKAEKSKYHPQVYLYSNYVLYQGDTLADNLTPDWYAGIGINVPLFDNSGRSEKVQAAQSSVLQVRYLYQQAIQDLSVLVKKTYFSAQQAIEEAQGLDASLALAQENLKLRVKAFNQGLSTSVEVVDAELFLASIKIQQQVAKFNYVIALNKLLSLSSEMTTFSDYEASAI